jgi:nucleotide-binding universal stress UspA family protein
MSFKTILVHIDHGQASASRVDAAVRLARAFGARLVGLYIVPGAELTPSVAAVLPPGVVEERLRATGEAQSLAEARFRETAAAAGLSGIEWRAPTGAPIDAAVAHGRCTDLFVMGQRDPSELVFTEEIVATAVLSTGRPTLVVPYIGAGPTLGENVLVAWNGGREAARAVGDAMPFLERAKRVNVISVEAEREETVDEHLTHERLAAWLRGHGVAADIARQEASDVGIGEWLLSRAADLGSDMIVMGGYAHARMRELILGGVTQTMLRSMTIPVLMSH